MLTFLFQAKSGGRQNLWHCPWFGRNSARAADCRYFGTVYEQRLQSGSSTPMSGDLRTTQRLADQSSKNDTPIFGLLVLKIKFCLYHLGSAIWPSTKNLGFTTSHNFRESTIVYLSYLSAEQLYCTVPSPVRQLMFQKRSFQSLLFS